MTTPSANGTGTDPRHLEPNRLDIEATLRAFHPDGRAFEVRAFRPNGKVVPKVYQGGDVAAAVMGAVKLGREGCNVYFTLNPIDVTVLGRAQSASDDHIAELLWLPIDVDPTRAEGAANEMATAEERASVAPVLKAVQHDLQAAGLVNPVTADSGNGAHACYPIRLPNDAGGVNKEFVRQVLQALDRKHSIASADVDVTVHNPSRIWRLYGTANRKGSGAAPRYHRPSRLGESPKWCPAAAAANTEALRRWLAANPAPEPPRPPSPDGTAGSDDHAVRAYVARAFAEEVAAVSGAPVKNRNNQLNQSAFNLGTLVGAGVLSRESVEAALYGAALQAGLKESEIRKTIRSGLEAGIKKPRDLSGVGRKGAPPEAGSTRAEASGGEADSAASAADWPDPIPLGEVPTVPPFPVDVLPAKLQALVRETAQAMNCPPDYVGVPMLAMAGGAIGNAYHLTLAQGHTQAPCLYAAPIGRPGTCKSAPLKMLRRPFDEAQRRYLDTWRKEMLEWKEKKEDDRGPLPVLRRCIVADITTESLGLALQDTSRGLCMVRDELVSLVTSMNQYKNGKGQDRQVYLALWAGETIMIDRKSDRIRDGAPLFVSDPFVSICGGLQPSVLRQLLGDGAKGRQAPDDGFLDRFLLAYPDELPSRGETWLGVTEPAKQAWVDVVQKMLTWEMVEEKKKKEDGEDEETRQRPFFLNLTEDGRRKWKLFTEAHAAELNAEDFPAHLVGPWAKLRGYCAGWP